MIEAVDWRRHRRLLRDLPTTAAAGRPVMALQAITIADRATSGPSTTTTSSAADLPRRLPAVGHRAGRRGHAAQPTCASSTSRTSGCTTPRPGRAGGPTSTPAGRPWRRRVRPHSGGSGTSTSPTARGPSSSATSATSRWCWPAGLAPRAPDEAPVNPPATCRARRRPSVRRPSCGPTAPAARPGLLAARDPLPPPQPLLPGRVLGGLEPGGRRGGGRHVLPAGLRHHRLLPPLLLAPGLPGEPPASSWRGRSSVPAAQRGPLWWAAHHRRHHRPTDRPGRPALPGGRRVAYAHVFWMFAPANQGTDLDLVEDLAAIPSCASSTVPLPRPRRPGRALFLGGHVLRGHWSGPCGRRDPRWWSGACASRRWSSTRPPSPSTPGPQGRHPALETTDDSRNNWGLALVTLGEGWHNNHHRFPGAARQGYAPWELDITWLGLRVMAGLDWPATCARSRPRLWPWREAALRGARTVGASGSWTARTRSWTWHRSNGPPRAQGGAASGTPAPPTTTVSPGRAAQLGRPSPDGTS